MIYTDAMDRMRANPHSNWAAKSADAAKPDDASNRVHQGFARIASTAPFRLSRSAKFFCVGSCFAREIEDAIEDVGLTALTKARALEMIGENRAEFGDTTGLPRRRHAFLNRYNSGSMDYLIRNAAGGEDDCKLLYSNGHDQFYDYHYTRLLPALPRPEAEARRRRINAMYHDALREADVFVFTLGLAECFFDLGEGEYLNVTPDRRAAAGHDLEFRFLTLGDTAAMLRRIVANVRRVRPDCEIVVTVSPVPLDVTFTGMDIVAANNLSKATLLAAAHAVCGDTAGVHYFPSYDMVMMSEQSRAWLWDRKHVAPGMVRHIMQSFIDRHISPG